MINGLIAETDVTVNEIIRLVSVYLYFSYFNILEAKRKQVVSLKVESYGYY